MVNKTKRKRRLRKSLARRRKERTDRAWRNLFVKAGVLQDK
ncbi:DUF3983 domain-containing protein [Cytobacillus sp. Bac17]|nr:DUF3983 domain-containing protein [Cytobacillus sp. Bac17]